MIHQPDEGRHSVYWQDEIVGDFSNPVTDMWYLEGQWYPVDTPKSAEFHKAIASLQGKAFWKADADDYVWVRIPSLDMKCVVVQAPNDNVIVFRMVTTVEPPQR